MWPQPQGKLSVPHGSQLHNIYLMAPGHPHRRQTQSLRVLYISLESTNQRGIFEFEANLFCSRQKKGKLETWGGVTKEGEEQGGHVCQCQCCTSAVGLHAFGCGALIHVASVFRCDYTLLKVEALCPHQC